VVFRLVCEVARLDVFVLSEELLFVDDLELFVPDPAEVLLRLELSPPVFDPRSTNCLPATATIVPAAAAPRGVFAMAEMVPLPIFATPFTTLPAPLTTSATSSIGDSTRPLLSPRTDYPCRKVFPRRISLTVCTATSPGHLERATHLASWSTRARRSKRGESERLAKARSLGDGAVPTEDDRP
jgi:hypothetical protein